MANRESVKKVIEDILGKIGISHSEIVVAENESGKQSYVIKTAESGMLIGSKGENISALNHLIKRIIGKTRKEGEMDMDFYVDVNDYHEKLLQDLKNKAMILAERARSMKINVEMDPMSSYERMIVHSFFENVKDIKTESVGIGKNRAVVIKFVSDEGF